MKTMKDQMELLENVGITGINDENIKNAQASWNGIPNEIRKDMSEKDMLYTALIELGCGRYNSEDGTWTLTSNCVYSFDGEIYDIGNMFSNVLKGIVAINNNEFAITKVTEIQNEMNEDGTGKQTVQFYYNDKPYVYEGKLNYDWFDIGFFEFFNKVLEKENNPKRLQITSDGTQMIIVFYNTDEWAREFTEKVGLEL